MKKVLLSFIKDQVLFTTAYFLCGFFLILFYSILTGEKVEIAYPSILSVFIFFIFIVIRWFQYYRFIKRLPRAVENMDYDLSPATCEQADVQQIIGAIHQHYAKNMENSHQDIQRKNRLISQWVHNMKTPVTVMDLILQKEAIDDNDFENMRQENAQLRTFLDQILVLLRLDDFAKDYVPEVRDLAAEVKEVINSRRNQFIYSHVFPKLESPDRVVVLTDSKWNRMMIDQIVSNAIKYSAARDKSKTVHFQITAENGKAVLSIKDEGIGIPEYDLGRVLEPFFTGENGRKVADSSGIGLFMCAEIAKKLGHKLEITSEQGRGTVVSVSYLTKL